MTVYLGTHGQVELQREFDGSVIEANITAADVNATARRFKFDYAHGQLLTGDQIEIKPIGNSTSLPFITANPSGTKKFIYIDELDGIRLYDSFADAVNGGVANATALSSGGYTSVDVEVKVENASQRLLAQCNGYELNTERETVDTTTLSDDFRNRISTLMSGSGRMSCFWDYTGNSSDELANYLLELQIRTRVGSQFKARFYLKTNAYNPSGDAARSDDEIWYEFTGVLTNCAVQFNPSNVVEITADFITTGVIQIRMDLDVGSNLLLGAAGGGTLLTQAGNQLQQVTAGPGVTLALTTTSFTDGGAIGAAYFHDQSPCTGSNTSPQLSWTASGVDTSLIASYKLLCVDLDASNFIHWSVDDIPISTTSIAENGTWPGGVTINQTGYGTPVAGNGWEGPCPPSGTHNYRITLSAIDSGGNELTNATLNFTAT
jgi:phosphatidylethanolamine-binding protein (PEBP) family uncharacterized protein